MRFCIVGGGAAGMFAAIAAKANNPQVDVVLLEKSAVLLSKVRISGGGRCNVTHACFDPNLLIQHYPRGGKELLGPFHRFQPQDTIEWFESRGVLLKTERDGRMFPVTDRSETIIQCLIAEAQKLGVEILFRQRIETITKNETTFTISMKDAPALPLRLHCDALILATGSSQEGFEWAKSLGHSIQSPVPSLFTFNVPTSPLKELSGIAIEKVELNLEGIPFLQKEPLRGPLLITHFGFSGPAALKLSAWAARALHAKEYRATLNINWLPDLSQDAICKLLVELKAKRAQHTLISENPFNFPKNFWKVLLGDAFHRRLSEISQKDLQLLAQKLHADAYQVEGKTTNKEEFVTCGGVTLKEVDFKTMQSKICPGLFFAGEILDIDGVTGGFNFQNAWTTGYIAGSSC